MVNTAIRVDKLVQLTTVQYGGLRPDLTLELLNTSDYMLRVQTICAPQWKINGTVPPRPILRTVPTRRKKMEQASLGLYLAPGGTHALDYLCPLVGIV